MTAILHNAREQWIMYRSERVTATDGADIICHALGDDSAHAAPAEILGKKWGLIEDDADNNAAMWGRELQDSIGRVYSKVTGREVVPAYEFSSWQHPDIPWLAASGDALYTDTPGSRPKPLEIKTDGSRWTTGGAWFGAGAKPQEAVVAPFRHQTQNLIQQACLGSDGGAVTAFVDRFRPLISQDVPWNQRFFDSCLPLLEEFHHYLKTRTLPSDPSWYTKAAVKAFWPNGNGQLVAFDHDHLRLVNRWERLKLFKAWAEKEKDRCEVALAVSLGDAESGLLPDGSSYRLKRSLVAAQSCECGHVIRAEHTRAVPSRFWPKHLKPAKHKALAGSPTTENKE